MTTVPKRLAIVLLIACACLRLTLNAQSNSTEVVAQYWEWREVVNPPPEGEDPLELFKQTLIDDGLSSVDALSSIELLRKGLIEEEGEFYDEIYEKGPRINTSPNRLLVEAVKGRPPGRALDVGMGQGRNAVFLAQRGWNVTGFDPSAVGLRQAHENAAKLGVELETVKAGAEYFDFGRERWDLIAIIYPIEKFSVFKVHEALKSGGLVVIEATHKESAAYPFHYDSNELLEIFRDFRILRYEDINAVADWELKERRLVRLIAQKPR